jgi:two-component system sensor histidine kinase BaeS
MGLDTNSQIHNQMPDPDFPYSHSRGWRTRFRPHHRPPWWPENEEWPPREARPWRHMGRHNPFFRRLGCLFAVFSFVALSFFILVTGFILDALGITHFSVAQFQSWLPFGGFFLALVIVVNVLAGMNLRRMSVPLDDLLTASKRVAEGDYSIRVDEQGPPEVRSLARAFNSMAARLQVHDQERRNMLADVTHELRTPLTIIQGNLEGMLDGMYAADEARLKSILDETGLLSRLISDLRTLALAESGALHLKRELTDLATLIREAVQAFATQSAAQEVKIEITSVEISALEVDPERMREVLSNLLINALRYTPRGGTIHIGMETQSSGDERSAKIIVQDDGRGIAPAELPHIFDRYYKSGDSSGMGLGLAIARYLVEAHGGAIKAESEAGKGTRISFTIPY